jgi:hypothetical protein
MRKVLCEAYWQGAVGKDMVWVIPGWFSPGWWNPSAKDEHNCTGNTTHLYTYSV